MGKSEARQIGRQSRRIAGKPAQLTDDPGDQSGVAWLPGSKRIVFSTDSERPDVAMMNVDTGAVRILTDDGQSAFAFWYDSSLGVEATGRALTTWAAVKGQLVGGGK